MKWKETLQKEFQKDYFKELKVNLKKEYEKHTVFPEYMNVFRAFRMTPYHSVKVVIYGQDPYHGDGQADGLAFSVPTGVKVPPSLKNIFKEIKSDLGIECKSGNLANWAQQGVLLLNSVLSVRKGTPGSHEKLGWTIFTDKVIKVLDEDKTNLVFMFWGNLAKEKSYLVDQRKHLVLTAAHPSPLSVKKGFEGCKHFSKANEYLVSVGKEPIDWSN